jgi:hypothetical protein
VLVARHVHPSTAISLNRPRLKEYIQKGLSSLAMAFRLQILRALEFGLLLQKLVTVATSHVPYVVISNPCFVISVLIFDKIKYTKSSSAFYITVGVSAITQGAQQISCMKSRRISRGIVQNMAPV